MTPAEFRAAREALGLTQIALAKALGMKERQIRNLETGAVPIKRVIALAIEALAARADQR